MKHTRNSIKGVFILEHKGVPTSLVTDFNEQIIDGSLCIDRNNHNLYILRSGVWSLFSVGVGSGDFIPRGGTNVGQPVTGNIEIQDGVSFERGSTQVTFTNEALIFHFSDNDGNPADDCGVTMNQNIIFQRDTAFMSVDDASNKNFIYKVGENLSLNTSENNTVFADFNNLNGSNFDSNTLLGSFGIINIDNSNSNIMNSIVSKNSPFTKTANITGSSNNLVMNVSSNITNLTNVNDSVLLGTQFTLIAENIDNSKLNLDGISFSTMSASNLTFVDYDSMQQSIAFSNNIDNISYSNIKVSMGTFTIEQSKGLNILSDNISLSGSNANYLEIFGTLDGEFGSLSSITDSSFNKLMGDFESLTFINSHYNTIVGKLTSTNFNNTISHSNINAELDEFDFNSTTGYNQIQGEFNELNLDGDYNYLYTKHKDNSFDLTGSNNFIATESLNSTNGNAVSLDGSHNYMFGQVSLNDNSLVSSGNTVIGRVNLDSSLSDNNVIIAGKEINNIQHDNRSNNIFLNVDNFSVPEEDTVYLPCRYITVASGNFGIFNACNITSDQTWEFPDKTGTVALLDDIVGGGSTAGTYIPLVQITYNEAVSLAGSGGLTAGQFYQIEYQTIHLIPNTSEIHTGNTENLILFAVSGSDFDKRAISVEFPQDLIYYDIEDDTAEDLSTPRPGFIQYRKDVPNNNETWYDFRNVTYRRWKVDPDAHIQWSAGSNFIKDDAVYDSLTGTIYKCILTHTSTGTFDDEAFAPIFSTLSNDYLWDDSFVNIGAVTVIASTSFADYLTFETSVCRNVQIGKADELNDIVLLDNQFGSGSFCNDIYIDDNTTKMTIRGAYLKVGSNCSQIYIEQQTGYSTIADNVTDTKLSGQQVNIGESCADLLINSCTSLDIEQSCSQLSLNQVARSIFRHGVEDFSAKQCDSFDIGSEVNSVYIRQFCDNFFIGGGATDINVLATGINRIKIGDDASFITFSGSGCNDITIGNDSTNINFNNSGFNHITIGHDCNNINFNDGGSQNIQIGNLTENVTIGNNSDSTIGSDCDNITIGASCPNTIIGSQCENITLDPSVQYTKIGDNSTNIQLRSGGQYNSIGSGCDDIYLGFGCQNNNIGDSVDSSSAGDGSSQNYIDNSNNGILIGAGCSNNVIGSQCFSLSLPTGSQDNRFDAGFSNKSFTIPPVNLTVTISDFATVTYVSSFNNVTADMKDPSNGIWYKTIDILGTITTVLMT